MKEVTNENQNETTKNNTFTCAYCGKTYSDKERTIVQGEALCGECMKVHTLTCRNCGEVILCKNAVADAWMHICRSCYRQYYSRCEDCGKLLNENEVYYLHIDGEEVAFCESCYYQRTENSIHDYYYRPTPIFYDVTKLPRWKEEDKRYFGIELEIDGAGEYNDYAEQITDIANQQREHIYCKHDGSLEEGFEIVSHPMTKAYHMQQMPWEETLQEARRLRYCSHQAGTCGLHIHVNRNSLGKSYEEQEETIARILYFFEKHWAELIKFSRRSQRQLERWATRYGYKERPKEILKYAKEDCNCDRYTCVNLQNNHTIEFRMFRGTLKYNTLIATLQLVDRVCEVAFLLNDEEIKELTWTEFVRECNEKELVQYLKERNLYINEPIEQQEEEI